MLRAWLAGSHLFDRKSLEAAQAEAERSGFRRALGPVSITAVGVAGMIGAGIFFLLGQEAGTTGPAVIVSLLIGGVAAALAALTFAEFASLVPGSGSAYAYAYTGLGRLPAFLLGWFILNSYMVGNMAVAIGWSVFFSTATDALGLPISEAWLANPFDGGLVNLPALIVVGLVTLLTLPKIRESAAFNNLLVFIKVAIVLFVILFGLAFVQADNYVPFNPGGSTAVVGSAAVLFFAYLGFDTAAATAEEARNPRRDLPIGILASVFVSMTLYIAMAAVVTGMTAPEAVGDDEAVVAVAFAREGHAWATGLITAGALVALATVLYAFQLALSRILFAMARDGFLPQRFTRLHPTTATPWAITLWTGGVTALGAGLLPLGPVVDMAVLAIIWVYAFVAVGVLALKAMQPEATRTFSVHWTVPVAAVAVLLYIAFYGIAPFLHLAFAMWVGLGLAVYGFYAHTRALRSGSTPAVTA